MGNVNNKDDNLKFKYKLKNDSLGIISLYKNKIDKKFYLKKSIKTDNNNEYNEILKRITDFKDIDNKFSIPISFYKNKEKTDFFVTLYKIDLYFNFYDNSLEKVINEKRKKIDNGVNNLIDNKFTEEELWYWLYSLISYSISIEKIGYFHDDLQPKNIFFNEEGILIMYPNFIFNNKGIINSIKNNNYKSPLSPEIIEIWNNKNKDIIQYDPEKNIIWNIGISILCSATLNHFSLFYNNNFDINYNNITKEFIKLSKMYSKEFITCIENLLKFNSDLRPSLKEIIDFWSKFEIIK